MTPTLAGHSFDPASRSYTNVTTAQAAQDYASTQARKVSGSVTLNGLAIPNVTLTFTNGPTCAPTNLSGQFTCYVPDGWSGSLTPSASGYTFAPASRNFTTVSSDQTGQGFSAALDGSAEAIYFVHVDHLNTPRVIYDGNQQLRWKWEQAEPFGNTAPDENPAGLGVFEQPLRFPGQYADRETNLHHNYFRDYDPAIGRYEESDPIGLRGGLNTYLYVRAHPIWSVDPTGLVSQAEADYIGGLGGKAAKEGGKELIKNLGIPGTAGEDAGAQLCRLYNGRRPINLWDDCTTACLSRQPISTSISSSSWLNKCTEACQDFFKNCNKPQSCLDGQIASLE